MFPVIGKDYVPEDETNSPAEGMYFPMPADVQCRDNDGRELEILRPGALKKEHCDLPAPLTMGLFKEGDASKAKPNPWISCRNLQQYLGGKIEPEQKTALYDIESRPGIGIDPQTGTADTGTDDEGGKFYIAEYMRLRDGVALKGFATAEALEPYFADSKKIGFVFGGQRGVALLDGVRDDAVLPAGIEISGTRIKWVTLTPSIFTGGWLPSWVDKESGAIKGVETLKPPREPRESRKDWRARFETTPIPGKLVAACIPKPVPYSGWKAHATDKEGAKPTRLCVPAGAVYYFETKSEEETQRLVQFLNGKRKSDMAAEKGFGFGLCGVWEEFNKEGENQ